MVEKILNSDLYASGSNYMLLGQEKQTLQLVLMPGQEISTKQQALLYASDNIMTQKFKTGCCGKLCALLPSIRSKARDDQMNLLLKNDTSTIGYVGLQLMKGKVIVIDNKLDQTKNMVVKNKYVVAHTNQVSMRQCRPGARYRQRNEGNNGQDANMDAWNNDPNMMGPEFIQMGTMMSQIVSNKNDRTN